MSKEILVAINTTGTVENVVKDLMECIDTINSDFVKELKDDEAVDATRGNAVLYISNHKE